MATTAQKQYARTRPLSRRAQDGRQSGARRIPVGTAQQVKQVMTGLGRNAYPGKGLLRKG